MNKERKLYDCFTYFQEDDILEIRLNVLKDVVDYFVISESNKTHSNKDKEYRLEALLETKFKDFKDKIIYVKHNGNNIPDGLDFTKANRYTPSDGYWYLEKNQRDVMKDAIIEHGVQDTDLVIIADLDEIPNPILLESMKKDIDGQHYKFMMYSKWYYLNAVRKDCSWGRASIGSFSAFKSNTFSDYRAGVNIRGYIPESGWHFTYMGGADMVSNKLKSFAHTEYNSDEFSSIEKVEDAIKNNGSLLSEKWSDELTAEREYEEITFPKYPKYIVENQDKYKHLIMKV